MKKTYKIEFDHKGMKKTYLIDFDNRAWLRKNKEPLKKEMEDKK